jgi:hypothetical protein
MCFLLEALPYSCTGSQSIYIGYCTHLLEGGIVEVLWSNEVTFLVGGRTVKQRVTRKGGELCYPECIQH